jgi:hypothetical protein
MWFKIMYAVMRLITTGIVIYFKIQSENSLARTKKFVRYNSQLKEQDAKRVLPA